MQGLQGSATTTEEKLASAEALATVALAGMHALPATAATAAVVPPKRPGALGGVAQQAKRRLVPVAALAPVLAAVAAVGDRSKEALDTPRTKLLPVPTGPYEWRPARINADAAPTGPNGVKEVCGLKAAEVKVLMCTVHVQRDVTKHKRDVVVDIIVVADADGGVQPRARRPPTMSLLSSSFTKSSCSSVSKEWSPSDSSPAASTAAISAVVARYGPTAVADPWMPCICRGSLWHPKTSKTCSGSLNYYYIVNRPGIRSWIPLSANYDADPHER